MKILILIIIIIIMVMMINSLLQPGGFSAGFTTVPPVKGKLLFFYLFFCVGYFLYLATGYWHQVAN